MSSNMVPEDDRGFWTRIADAEYGRASGRGENTNTFFGGIGGWQPEAGSRFDPTKEVGYFRFETGNPTRDAILSIAANELGVDNFVRAVNKLDEGNYWGAAGETVLAAASLVAVGAVPLVSALSRGHQVYKIAKATRAANLPAWAAQRAGPSTFTSAISPLGQATGQSGFSTPITFARTGPTPSLAARLGQAVGANRRPPVPAAAAGSGLGARAARIARVAGRRLAPLSLLATPAYLFGQSRADAAPTAAEAREIATGEADALATERTERDLVPGGNAEAEATNQARVNIAGINQQYNNILRELQTMYQLSETDEERERLRFMLADIEAQRDAGLQAISEGYAKTVGDIREQAVLSGERTTERAQRYGQDLEESADRAAQRMMLQNTQQQEQFRGLGSGSRSPVNEWVGLMSAMAPAQQLYTQRMGDISQEGMEWIANTVGAQGQAQSADLQRLAAATRSGTIANQQAQVSDRINRERELQRAAILQTMQQRAGALQSAEQFNASLGGAQPSAGDVTAFIESFVTGQNVTADDVQQALYARNQGQLSDAQRAYIERLREIRVID